MHCLVAALRPGLAVAFGDAPGGAFAALCEAMRRFEIPGQACAVAAGLGEGRLGPGDGDAPADPPADPSAAAAARHGSFAETVRASATDAPHVFADGSVDLLHIEGLHARDALRAAFSAWLPKLSAGGVVLLSGIAARREGFEVRRFWEDAARDRPAFAFPHGLGLGILAVGPRVPDPVAALCALDPAAGAAITERFARLGAGRTARQERPPDATAPHGYDGTAADPPGGAPGPDGSSGRRAVAAGNPGRPAAELEAERLRLAALTREQRGRIRELEDEAARMADLSAVQFERIAALETGRALDAERIRALEARPGLHRRIAGLLARPAPGPGATPAGRAAPSIPAGRTGSAPRVPDWEHARRAVRESGLFDADFYRIDNPEVALAGLDPLDHYLTAGWRAGRRPSAEFDPEAYRAACPPAAEVEPITHRLTEAVRAGAPLPDGALARAHREARDATVRRVRDSGLFDAAFYAAQNPIVQETGVDPALHYVVSGHRAFLDPAAGLSAAAFRAAEPAFRSADRDLVSYLLDGARDPYAPGFAHPSQGRWVFAEHPYRLPDEAVRIAQTEGVRYLARYGFRPAPGGHNRLVVRAVADLAATAPRLCIDGQAPDASIVIPVHGQTHFALACLDALAAHASRFSAEILLMDDASPEAAQVGRLGAVPWLRYVRRPRNGGFIAACNDGAARARGRVVVLLNSDTRVVPGWLDELMESFRTFPRAGLVGSKLYGADGELQEAGGILWRDGSAWNYGRGGDPDDPRYGFARQVDYCSAAAIGVTREAWARAGGLDDAFAPAYYEDADLALRVRALGFETWFQPLARVIHYEGMTHGRDLLAGVKVHQVENGKRFAARHAAALGRHRERGTCPDAAAVRARGRRMLVLDADTPRPDRDAGSDLADRIMAVFRSLGYSQTFVPQANFLYAGRHADALRRIGVELAYAPFRTGLPDVLGADARGIELCLLFRYAVAQAAIPTLRERLPVSPILFHNIDMHYLRERRAAELTGDRAGLIAAQRTMSDELAVSALADATIVTNANERAEIDAALGAGNVVVMPYVAEVCPSEAGFAARSGVLFLGGFRHAPNADAVRHFLAETWPILEGMLPEEARFTVIGADLPPDLGRGLGERVEVVGHVEDLKPWFDRARVFVAPLRFGAGVKGKVIQSLRHGLPAVVTGIAAEGVGLRAGEHVLVEDEPEAFAAAVARLHADPAAWAALQRGGYRFIAEAVSWERGRAACEAAIDAACATWTARTERRRARTLRRLMRT